MHIYFSGIGGTGVGPLALIAHRAGFTVSGSDKQQSSYIEYLKKHGVTDIHIGQEYDQMQEVHDKNPIDWFVFTSALPIEHPDAPELRFCLENNIRLSKRDEFLNYLLADKKLKLIAVAGTHGKTTTTALAIWLFKQLGIPISYSVGAKLSFGDMGEFDPKSEYFVYEADEFDRNFLAFRPYFSLITGIDWDHPDIYPTKVSYDDAFKQFLSQSQHSLLWKQDARQLNVVSGERTIILDEQDAEIDRTLSLPGHVNRLNAWEVAHTIHAITGKPLDELFQHLDRFPGVARRFEQIAPRIFSDYAHTPPKVRGALQLAHEVAGQNVVVIYEGLHNTRQHFIRDELKDLFDSVKQLYVVPSYLAREDPDLALLSPEDLRALLNDETQERTEPAALDSELSDKISQHVKDGDLVLALSAGGGGSLDEWLRTKFAA
ncbi:MAG: Mur ligase domain-containing protein [Candidatus Saccharimonadales bacterium]